MILKMFETLKDLTSWLHSLPTIPKLMFSALILLFSGLILSIIWSAQVGRPGASDAEVVLSDQEKIALGLILTDPMAGGRGTWTIPLHQQLTYRGMSDAQATQVLMSLQRKGLVVSVEYEEFDSYDKKIKKIPATQVTERGVDVSMKIDGIDKVKETYIYKINLLGEETENEVFLRSLRAINFVQGQTRFVNPEKNGQSTISVFAYMAIDEKEVRRIASNLNVIITQLEGFN